MDIKYIHFVGIGGIGISGLARYIQSQGVNISGSDIAISCSTKYLENLGVKISIPHNPNNILEPDLVVHSAIIKDDNVELVEARRKGIKVSSRSEALKLILGQKRVFSVCGAHGKSSTTAMLSAILKNYGAIIGAESKEFNSNVREIRSNEVIFEADESDGSFLNSNPYCAIVTNAEPEHMEYYNYDLELFHNHYERFLQGAHVRVINAEDEFLSTLNFEAMRLYPSKDIKNIRYKLEHGEPKTCFELYHNDKFIGNFEVWGFGIHTTSNASLAILASLNELKVNDIANNLKSYCGIKKRFDIVYHSKECVIIDDYAHHPTEIKSTLESVFYYAKLHNFNDISIIWQPHKYSRILHNLDGFVKCFGDRISRLIILPIWGASEAPIDIDLASHFSVYEPIFVDKILKHGGTLKLLRDNEVIKILDSGLIVGFGAGDITYQLRGGI